MRAIRYPLVVQDPESEIKRWQTPPPVAQVRPTHCTWCKAASQPVGKPLVLVGHGVRERQLRGPLRPQGPPRLVVVFVRRFLCRQCTRTLTVGPEQRQRQRLYSASTIMLALVLWSLCGLGSEALRERLSPWVGAAAGSWTSLGRWVKAALGGRLWPFPYSLGPSLRLSLARAYRDEGLVLDRSQELPRPCVALELGHRVSITPGSFRGEVGGSQVSGPSSCHVPRS